MRAANGGWVASKLKNEPAKASPKNMWLTSWAWASRIREPSGQAADLLRAPGDAARIAGELDRRSVGQVLASGSPPP